MPIEESFLRGRHGSCVVARALLLWLASACTETGSGMRPDSPCRAATTSSPSLCPAAPDLELLTGALRGASELHLGDKISSAVSFANGNRAVWRMLKVERPGTVSCWIDGVQPAAALTLDLFGSDNHRLPCDTFAVRGHGTGRYCRLNEAGDYPVRVEAVYQQDQSVFTLQCQTRGEDAPSRSSVSARILRATSAARGAPCILALDKGKQDGLRQHMKGHLRGDPQAVVLVGDVSDDAASATGGWGCHPDDTSDKDKERRRNLVVVFR